MSSAMCWKNVDVVRPHPGHAVTCGAKLRSPSDCRICCDTNTSSVRSPPGLGVSETRIVSPMPSASRMDEAGRARHDAFGAESRFGETQVERVVAAGGEAAVDIDQVGDQRHLGGDDDAIVAEASVFGEGSGAECALEHGLDIDIACVVRLGAVRVLIHHRREQVLIERSPIHADADRLAVGDGDFDDRAEVFVAAFACRHCRD